MTLEINVVHHGDALSILKTMPDALVDLVITSPPYYGLRDYGVFGQIGREPTPALYIQSIVNVFNECKRILRPSGSLWVNISDSYGGTGDKKDFKDPKNKLGRNGQYTSLTKHLRPKSLIGIPSKLVEAMEQAKWIRRNDIIWHKPNAMPSPAKDRFTVDFEWLFFFTKAQKYYFNTQYDPNGRIKRSVWSIPTRPYPEAHYAVFPETLVETPIKACCPPNGVVLDPFMGSGTVAVVSKKQGKNYIGIELNKANIDMANNRVNQISHDSQLLL